MSNDFRRLVFLFKIEMYLSIALFTFCLQAPKSLDTCLGNTSDPHEIEACCISVVRNRGESYHEVVGSLR
jgi:hypothetical protein